MIFQVILNYLIDRNIETFEERNNYVIERNVVVNLYWNVKFIFIPFLEELILTWLIKEMYELLYKGHCLLLNAFIAVLTVISEGCGVFLSFDDGFMFSCSFQGPLRDSTQEISLISL